jgi:hypothetical protein
MMSASLVYRDYSTQLTHLFALVTPLELKQWLRLLAPISSEIEETVTRMSRA